MGTSSTVYCGKLVLSSSSFNEYEISSISITGKGNANATKFSFTVKVGSTFTKTENFVSGRTEVTKNIPDINASGDLVITLEGTGFMMFNKLEIKYKKSSGPKTATMSWSGGNLTEGTATATFGTAFNAESGKPIVASEGIGTIKYSVTHNDESDPLISINEDTGEIEIIRASRDENDIALVYAQGSNPLSGYQILDDKGIVATSLDIAYYLKVDKAPSTLTWSTEAFSAMRGKDDETAWPTVTGNPEGMTITYSIAKVNDTDPETSTVATIDANSGAITTVGEGSVKVVASAAALNDNYKAPAPASYILTVEKPSFIEPLVISPEVNATSGQVELMVGESFRVTTNQEGVTLKYHTVTNPEDIEYTSGTEIKPAYRPAAWNYTFTATLEGEDPKDFTWKVKVKRYDLNSAQFTASSKTFKPSEISDGQKVDNPLIYDGLKEGLEPKVVLSSSNTEVATINDQNEVILTGKEGTTTIKAVIGDGMNYNTLTGGASYSITVSEYPMVSFDFASGNNYNLEEQKAFNKDVSISEGVASVKVDEKNGAFWKNNDNTYGLRLYSGKPVVIETSNEYVLKKVTVSPKTESPAKKIVGTTKGTSFKNQYGTFEGTTWTASTNNAELTQAICFKGQDNKSDAQLRIASITVAFEKLIDWQIGETVLDEKTLSRTWNADDWANLKAVALNNAEFEYSLSNNESGSFSIDSNNKLVVSGAGEADLTASIKGTTVSSTVHLSASAIPLTFTDALKDVSNISHEHFDLATLEHIRSGNSEAWKAAYWDAYNGEGFTDYGRKILADGSFICNEDFEEGEVAVTVEPQFEPNTADKLSAKDKEVWDNADTKHLVDFLVYEEPTALAKSSGELIFKAKHAGTYKLTFDVKPGSKKYVLAEGQTPKSIMVTINPTDDMVVIPYTKVSASGDLEFWASPENLTRIFPGTHYPGDLWYKITYQPTEEDETPANRPAYAKAETDAEGYTKVTGYGINLANVKSLSLKSDVNGLPFKTELNFLKNEATSVEGVEMTDGEAVWFDLQGNRVENPGAGIYIRIMDGKAVKVMRR